MSSEQPIRDYLPLPTFSLGVVGSVTGYAEGPQFSEFKGDRGGRTTVMAVQVEGILKGAAPKSRMVYVQLMGTGTPQEAAKAVPEGTAVALMLEPTRNDLTLQPVRPEAGRPHGEPLWIPGAQGLIVSNGPGGGVSYPRADLDDPGVRLDDFVTKEMKALRRPVVMLD